jgi:guanylate kinase
MLNKNKFHLLGNQEKGSLFIVSAPAGTGKTTLIRLLTEEFACVKMSVSFTTRKPRVGEIQGIHYHFISVEEFERKIEQNDFLEHVKLYGDYYGTSKEWVESQLNAGAHVVLNIDTQGALHVKELYPATFIFILPPSLAVLRERLVKRKTELENVIEQRLAWAEREMALAYQYDYILVNEDLSTAYQVLRSILIAEEHRKDRVHNQTSL